MIIAFIAALATADPSPVVFVDDGSTATAIGPAHIVPKERMDEIILRLKNGDDYEVKLIEALDELDKLGPISDRLSASLVAVDERDQTIQDHEAFMASQKIKLVRRTNERNIAIGVAATAVVAMGAGAYLLR